MPLQHSRQHNIVLQYGHPGLSIQFFCLHVPIQVLFWRYISGTQFPGASKADDKVKSISA